MYDPCRDTRVSALSHAVECASIAAGVNLHSKIDVAALRVRATEMGWVTRLEERTVSYDARARKFSQPGCGVHLAQAVSEAFACHLYMAPQLVANRGCVSVARLGHSVRVFRESFLYGIRQLAPSSRHLYEGRTAVAAAEHVLATSVERESHAELLYDAWLCSGVDAQEAMERFGKKWCVSPLVAEQFVREWSLRAKLLID